MSHKIHLHFLLIYLYKLFLSPFQDICLPNKYFLIHAYSAMHLIFFEGIIIIKELREKYPWRNVRQW